MSADSETLVCAACGAVLPSAFPGASIACACGHRVEIAQSRASRPGSGAPSGSRGPSSMPASAHGAGPYRSAGGGAPEAMGIDAPCPYCGNTCPAMVRICPHCDVRFDNVRCQRCFSLQAPGAFSCSRCGHGLELEPLLDATDAPCPRCNHPLEVAPGEDTRVHECPRCGGMFVPRAALAEILCSAEIGGALRDGPVRQRSSAFGGSTDVGGGGGGSALDVVRYVPCPLCHTPMNRVNFGRVSGVVVDVCKAHGTWFDAGELTSVVAFAAAGGLEKTRKREDADKKEQRSQVAAQRVHLVAAERDRHRDRTEEWRDFLDVLFRW